MRTLSTIHYYVWVEVLSSTTRVYGPVVRIVVGDYVSDHQVVVPMVVGTYPLASNPVLRVHDVWIPSTILCSMPWHGVDHLGGIDPEERMYAIPSYTPQVVMVVVCQVVDWQMTYH